ncbi:hypothetical protein GCM10010448_24240 [Streptomyces glomeratus]|jgi:hypothetical protein|uniref:5'-nucleotidase n=1 Tax=Streptomyces glomeratus TaxID=284452 RepID=A0ABP6LEB7_9ACTN
MGKRMLRSVLVATFSAVVAFGTLSGLSGTKEDVRADSVWSLVPASSVAGSDTPVGTDDSVWS